MANYRNKIEYVTDVLKALSDESRLRVVMSLEYAGELCVCQILELLDLAPSTVSKHLSILKHAGLIQSRKKGRWIHYSLSDGDKGRVVCDCLKFLLDGDDVIGKDVELLDKLMREDKEEICQRQKKN